MQARKGKVVYTPQSNKEFFIDGVKTTEAKYNKAFPSRLDMSQPAPFVAASYRVASEGMAVDPEQIPEAMARDARHGVKVDYNEIGAPVFTSRAQRAKYLKMKGCFDKDGGYSD